VTMGPMPAQSYSERLIAERMAIAGRHTHAVSVEVGLAHSAEQIRMAEEEEIELERTPAMVAGDRLTPGQRRMLAVLREPATMEDREQILELDHDGLRNVAVPSRLDAQVFDLYGPPARNHAGCWACNYALGSYAARMPAVQQFEALYLYNRKKCAIILSVKQLSDHWQREVVEPTNRCRLAIGLSVLNPWHPSTIYEHFRKYGHMDAEATRYNQIEDTAEMIEVHKEAQLYRRNMHDGITRIPQNASTQLMRLQARLRQLQAPTITGRGAAGDVAADSTNERIAGEMARDSIFNPERFSIDLRHVAPKTPFGKYV
jgi:hypothetical protein